MTMKMMMHCFVLLMTMTCCLAATLSTGEDVARFVRSRIDGNQVTVFAKSYCPYCKRTKFLLQDYQDRHDNFHVETVELDTLPGDDGPMIQRHLLDLTGQRTVPNIFIQQQHIGGNSDLQELHAAGKLLAMLLEEVPPEASADL